MSIKLKDTIYDLIDKSIKDSSGNTITSTYLKLSGGTLTAAVGTYIVTYNSTDGEFCVNTYAINNNRKADIGYLHDSTRCGVYIYNVISSVGISANDDGEIYKISATDFKKYKIFHSGNHGAGSGLNADLLDGYHASAFSLSGHTHTGYALSDHTHPYLPLTGGTLTGKLTIDTSGGYAINIGNYISWDGNNYPVIKSNTVDGWIMFINPHIVSDDMNGFTDTSCIRLENKNYNSWDITAGNNGAKDFRISMFTNGTTSDKRNTVLKLNYLDSTLGVMQVSGSNHPIIYGNGTYLTLGYTDAISDSDYGVVIEKSDFRPTKTNTKSLGLSNYIWSNIFSSSCNINYGQFNNSSVHCKNTTRAIIINSATWTWGGLTSSYPIIYSQPNSGTDNGDRYTMIAFPHIPYLEKNKRSYTGATFGAICRYESDSSGTTFWDCGVISTDIFGIRRGTTNYFTIGTNGAAFINDNGASVLIAANSSGKIEDNSCIELMNGTGYIDWHFNGSSEDFTSRIIESSSGTLTVNKNLNIGGTFLIGGEAITFTT